MRKSTKMIVGVIGTGLAVLGGYYGYKYFIKKTPNNLPINMIIWSNFQGNWRVTLSYADGSNKDFLLSTGNVQYYINQGVKFIDYSGNWTS